MDDYKWYSGLLIDKNENVRFIQYTCQRKLKVGDWVNCIDKSDLEQKYCVTRINGDFYYFEKREYRDNSTDTFPFYK